MNHRLDHFAVSPRGLYPGRVVVRVLAYHPTRLDLPGLRLRIQACTSTGAPIGEDPLIAMDGVDAREVDQMVKVSQAEGWTFFPFASRLSSCVRGPQA